MTGEDASRDKALLNPEKEQSKIVGDAFSTANPAYRKGPPTKDT